MKILFKLSSLVLVAGLAACQHTLPNQRPDPVDPAPPTVRSQGSTPSAAAPRQQSAAVITLHLAQQRREPGLVEVNAGGEAPLHALPRPVLTQADMSRVSPFTAPDGSTFVLLEMNEQGIPKLRSITQQARGHYLLLSVQGNLASVAQIGDVINDGRLLVGTQSPQHSQAIIRMMRGQQP